MGWYGNPMIGPAFHEKPPMSATSDLRETLVSGERIRGAALPVLRHLLGQSDPVMYCDAALAKIRGMLRDLARNLLAARAGAAGLHEVQGFVEAEEGTLVAMLAADDAILAHAHALALETVLTERLQEAASLDPVVSPLLQQLIAAGDEDQAASAMEVLAAQARFLQHQQRMELSPEDLPEKLFLNALLVMRAHAGSHDPDAQEAERSLRDARRSAPNRLTLIDGLLADASGTKAQTLSVSGAGVAIFLSALARASGQDRSKLVLALFARDSIYPALAMRVAGLESGQIETQLAMLGVDRLTELDLAAISGERAADLLADIAETKAA